MIGLIDSGIGGATVLKEIIKNVPPQNYLYYSDSINNPYGDKSKEVLYEIVSHIVDTLIEKGCTIIVLACNTASALCKEDLRENYPAITFVAIEPAYKMVHDYNPKGKTLVMATKGTIESENFKKLYLKYDNHNTILYACEGLAERIESNNEVEIDNYIQKNILPFGEIENIVMGCTHYPIIKDQIRKYLKDVNFFDGSKGVSMELNKVLKQQMCREKDQNTIEFIDSSFEPYKKERFFTFLNRQEMTNK